MFTIFSKQAKIIKQLLKEPNIYEVLRYVQKKEEKPVRLLQYVLLRAQYGVTMQCKHKY